MDIKKQRKWHSITETFTIDKQISDLLKDTQKQQKIFSQTKASLSGINDELIQRAEKLFTDRKEVINLYADQVEKWESEATTSSQKDEVTRLQNILTNIKKTNQKILDVMQYISQYKIENIIYR